MRSGEDGGQTCGKGWGEANSQGEGRWLAQGARVSEESAMTALRGKVR